MNNIIITGACFGSIFLFSISLKEINKMILHNNNHTTKYPMSLFILNSGIMATSGIFLTLLWSKAYEKLNLV